MRKLRIFLVIVGLGLLIGAASAQTNPQTQITWPRVTGSGAPTSTCPSVTNTTTTATIGTPYTDLTNSNQYTCMSPGWVQINGSGSFVAGGDLTGSSSVQRVAGLKSVPFCTGFTPTNGQAIEYTTGSSPNPCYTAATPSGGGANFPSSGTPCTVYATSTTASNCLTPTTFALLGTISNATTGNAATASALSVTPTLCGTGNAPTGILANGNATGCASISGGGITALTGPVTASGTGSVATTITGVGPQYSLPSSTGSGGLLASNLATDSTGNNLTNLSGKLNFQYLWGNPNGLSGLDSTERGFLADSVYRWTWFELLNTACGTGPNFMGAAWAANTGTTENTAFFGHLSPCNNSDVVPPDTNYVVGTGAAHQQYGTSIATITNVSLTSNVVTITAANSYSIGQYAIVFGLTAASFLNNQPPAIILSASSTQFTYAFTHANYGPASDAGAAEIVTDNLISIGMENSGEVNIGGAVRNPQISLRDGSTAPKGIFYPQDTTGGIFYGDITSGIAKLSHATVSSPLSFSAGVLSCPTCSTSTATVIQVNGTPTSTATPVNLQTSTANSVGLTITPSNPSAGNVKLEITGGAYTGTAANLSGTPALPNGTTATTQSPADNTAKLATDAFVNSAVSGANPPFNTIASGTNLGATMTCGGGCTINRSGGTIDASLLQSKAIAGTGAAIPTGPNSSVSGDVTTFTGTAGQIADSGTLLSSLAPLASPTFTGTVTAPILKVTSVNSGSVATIASASTITPVTPIIILTGSTTVHTITAPTGCTTGGTDCELIIVTDASGPPAFANDINIAAGYTMSLNSTYTLTYDPTNTKWYPPAAPSGGTPAYPQTVTGCVSGGVLYGSLSTQVTCSPAGTANVLMKWGGAATAPANTLATDNGTSLTYTGTGGDIAPVFTANGTTAGFIDFPQGTTSVAVAPCNTATSICEQAPTAVTSYLVIKPGVAGQGIQTNTLASTTITQGYSGDANHAATVTTGSGTSIGSTSLCSTTICPAGTYRVNVYTDITTACGTTGTYIVNLIYTDDQGSKTVPINLQGTGSVPLTGTLTTTSTSNFGQQAQIIRSTGAASINYSTTATACGTAGPMVGKLYLSVEPIQ